MTNVDPYRSPWRNSTASGFFHFPQSVNPHWHHRKIQVRSEQSDTASERPYLPVGGAHAFGEYHHAVAFVRGFAGKAEAFAEPAALRQRKRVEQGRKKPVRGAEDEALKPGPLLRRRPHALHTFSFHGDGEFSQPVRKRGKHESDIEIGDVIADHKDGPG